MNCYKEYRKIFVKKFTCYNTLDRNETMQMSIAIDEKVQLEKNYQKIIAITDNMIVGFLDE